MTDSPVKTLRSETARARVDALLSQWADQPPTASLYAPRSLSHITERLDRIQGSECRCGDSEHENALHDLVQDDVPVLLRLVEHLAMGGVL